MSSNSGQGCLLICVTTNISSDQINSTKSPIGNEEKVVTSFQINKVLFTMLSPTQL